MFCPPHVHDLMAPNDNMFGINMLQLNVKSKKICFTWFPKFHIMHVERVVGVIYTIGNCKKNVNNMVVYNPPIGPNTKKANENNKVPHTFQEGPHTRENPILLWTFQDCINDIIRENTSPNKDYNVCVRIDIKPSLSGQIAIYMS